jgi:hypothetical protein
MFRTLAYSVNSNFNKQSQFELFPVNGAASRPMEPPKQRFFLKSLTVSLESLVVIGMVMVMGLVVSYCVGIEKGKTQLRASASRPAKKKAVTQRSRPLVNPVTKNQPVQPRKTNLPVAPAAVPMVNEPAVIASGNPKVAPTAPLILEKVQDPALLAASDIEKLYTIQVASFKELKFAEQEASLLKRKGYDILVLPKGSHSIVCVGKFNQKEQAKTFSQKLKKQYKDCLVRSL